MSSLIKKKYIYISIKSLIKCKRVQKIDLRKKKDRFTMFMVSIECFSWSKQFCLKDKSKSVSGFIIYKNKIILKLTSINNFQ